MATTYKIKCKADLRKKFKGRYNMQ